MILMYAGVGAQAAPAVTVAGSGSRKEERKTLGDYEAEWRDTPEVEAEEAVESSVVVDAESPKKEIPDEALKAYREAAGLIGRQAANYLLTHVKEGRPADDLAAINAAAQKALQAEIEELDIMFVMAILAEA